ncbi:MAG: hypothetical protein LC685_05730 [Actinobacteria bacterium]|nr:hypothetical protein [Actinomycetota bacterium]
METVQLATTGSTRHCDGLSKPKQRQQRRALERDLLALRRATATMKAYAQDGNPAVNKALDRFMIDIANEALPVFDRSRFIDRAAAIVAPLCYLCFQTLEDNRASDRPSDSRLRVMARCAGLR